MSKFWFIDPVQSLPDGRFKRIATDRPTCYEVGPSSAEEIQRLACLADTAGHNVVLVKVPRPRYGDSVLDLYAEVNDGLE